MFCSIAAKSNVSSRAVAEAGHYLPVTQGLEVSSVRRSERKDDIMTWTSDGIALTMLGLVGCGAVAGAAAGSFLSVPELAVPLFAVAGAIAGAAAGMLFCFTR